MEQAPTGSRMPIELGVQADRGACLEGEFLGQGAAFWKPPPQGAPSNAKGLSMGAQRVYRILLAEDDLEMRSLLSWNLLTAGFDVVHCANGGSLLERLQQGCIGVPAKRFDLLITDIYMPGITGLEVLNALAGRKGIPPAILITAFGDEKILAQAKRAGAAGIFFKPFDVSALLKKVNQLLKGGGGASR